MQVRLIRICCGLAVAIALVSAAAAEEDWFPFPPSAETDQSPRGFSLRHLNEDVAGAHGFIAARDGQFVHSTTGQPIRLWGVNGPPDDLHGEALRRCARMLADYGVNLVRVHTPFFDRDGETDFAKVRRAQEVVAAFKAEGIYTHFSIYFPLWFQPRADHPWLEGYDGQQPPFAALMFHPQFQERHRSWLKALLTTPEAQTGRTLCDEPAVFGVELQNEDSFFFWTFDERRIPDRQLRMLEQRFAEWLKKKYGSPAAALQAWQGVSVRRDAPAEGRIGFRPLWNMFHEKTLRDQDTAAFLLETQTNFYRDAYAYVRQLGFRGLIHASNWATADPQTLGPLEKLSYTTGDFLDRHGYFECFHKGEHAAWSIRPGHTYRDRSALRFDANEPGQPRLWVHPVMDPHYQGKPSIISETTFTRPNRYRSEAPLYYATYGALQDSDGIIHFALDGVNWEVKPRFWMQQWTLCTPAMLGQFPAAAAIYRQGLVAAGEVMARVRLNKAELLRLQGTPLPQDAAFDELREQDVVRGKGQSQGARIDPLVHYTGRTEVEFVDGPGSVEVRDLRPFLDRAAQVVTSSTQEVRLDYGRGLLVLNAPRAQGASGALKAAGRLTLPSLVLSSDLELGHVVAVALDQQPLASSRRILLQVMSEERATDFATEPAEGDVLRITHIGRDPWQVRRLHGEVRFLRPDANRLKVAALDAHGRSPRLVGTAARITLLPTTLYYLIEAEADRGGLP
jgi:hypothetical protein